MSSFFLGLDIDIISPSWFPSSILAWVQEFFFPPSPLLESRKSTVELDHQFSCHNICLTPMCSHGNNFPNTIVLLQHIFLTPMCSHDNHFPNTIVFPQHIFSLFVFDVNYNLWLFVKHAFWCLTWLHCHCPDSWIDYTVSQSIKVSLINHQNFISCSNF